MTVTFGFSASHLFFFLELLIAELLFLFRAPKRKLFLLRFLLTSAISVLGIGFLPSIRANDYWMYTIYSLIRFLLLFAVSYLILLLSFSVTPGMLLPMCTAGYAVQHLSYRAAMLIAQIPALETFSLGRLPHAQSFELLLMPIFYALCYLIFGRYSNKHRFWAHSGKRFNAISILTIVVCVGLSRLYALFGEEHMSPTSVIYSMVACLLALYIQFNLYRVTALESENHTMDIIHREEKKQYEIAKSTMESFHIKVHDVKHKLAATQGQLAEAEAESIEQDIRTMENLIQTGVEELNVLLTQKSMECQNKEIRLSFSGDGSLLSFMDRMDIYSLFGNAVDNAIEASEKLTEPEKKLIDVSVESRGEMVFLHVTNYYSGKPIQADMLPETSKAEEPGYHGFGLKSMRRIAEKYHGSLDVSTHGDLFCLNIVLQK